VYNDANPGRPNSKSQLMSSTDVVNLTPLMQRGTGSAQVIIGLIDGPVALSHVDLRGRNIREAPGPRGAVCTLASSTACRHGTFVAGILMAARGSSAPAICPGCTLLIRPIFAEVSSRNEDMPTATPEELAVAILDSVKAGGRVLNLSAAIADASSKGERQLEDALNHAAQLGVIVVAAAGNQSAVGSSAITRHAAVIPVVACDLQGRPLNESNLGSSIGRHGLSAPGVNIASLSADGNTSVFSGTSAAAPFVTGAIALLWSEFPNASVAEIKMAVTQSGRCRRSTIVPPLLDAWAAYQTLTVTCERRGVS
jgi:subtilisin family serine protease